MPRMCSVFGCKSNYRGEPYTRVVSLPTKQDEKDRWIDALPNDRAQILRLKNVYICERHFDCDWITTRGGKRPSQPPSIFPNIPQSCMKQQQPQGRSSSTSAEARADLEAQRLEALDRIDDFPSFVSGLQTRFGKDHIIIQDGEDLHLSQTDPKGRSVTFYVHFQHVISDFGCIFVKTLEHKGSNIPKSYFTKTMPGCLQKNSLISRWSQLGKIVKCLKGYELKDADFLERALKELSHMSCTDSPHYQFLYGQLQLLLSQPTGRRFDKHMYILAAEIYTISPATYRMIRKSGSILLPTSKYVKKLLSHSLHDENLKALLVKLLPQQRLVNVLFDEVKLIETLRYSGGQVVGYAQNGSDDVGAETLATHAMVFEVVCHHGGPKYILGIHFVAKLNADQLKKLLINALLAVSNAGGTVVSCVCDNCATNVSVYNKFGGPGKVFMEAINRHVYLVFDYIHIFKNIRNNWITVSNKELTFMKDGIVYTARWADIEAIYNEDRTTSIRLTKLTYSSVYPKPLQRQSVPFVCQVFHEKTVAALSTLKDKLCISEGTIILIKLIVDWFHMMNVKDRYSGVKMRDQCRNPWTKDCNSFTQLKETCEVISTCAWQGGRGRTQKLTEQTANAFVVSTKTNIEAAELLLNEHGFSYVLPAIFADEALEKFFGQARQRSGGNFYIDTVDIKASAKTKNLHSLLQYELMPSTPSQAMYCANNISIDTDQYDLTITDTEELINSDETSKHKIIFLAGFLEHKFHGTVASVEPETAEDLTDSDFITNLNRGGLTVPKISTVHFVHAAHKLFIDCNLRCCRVHLSQAISRINSPMAIIQEACVTVSNIFLKAFVLDKSDKEKQLGCLRRREKLSN